MENTWQFAHLGIPVRNLDTAIENYKALGFATIKPEFSIDSSNFEEYLVYGKMPNPVVKTRGAFGKLGPIFVELLQPVQGHTVHKEFLENNGDGVGHVAYFVEDLEAEVAKLERSGFPVVLSFTPKGQKKRSGVYIDTRSKLSGLITELMQATG